MFTAQVTRIFSYTVCVFLLLTKSPEMSAGVNEVTEDGVREPTASPPGKVFATKAAPLFACSLSAERQTKKIIEPLVSLMVTEKCVRQHDRVPDISPGVKSRPLPHFIDVVRAGFLTRKLT